MSADERVVARAGERAGAGAQVLARSEDGVRSWSVVAQRMRGGQVVERAVEAGLGLVEAAERATAVRRGLEEEGWSPNGRGGFLRVVEESAQGRVVEVVYVYVNGE